MSKRRSSVAPNTSKPKVSSNDCMTFPETCLVCDGDIHQNCVLFHCECVVALCHTCAMRQISFQQSTYMKGILCPYCRKSSDNIRGVEECRAEEDLLVASAIENYKIRTSRNDDGIRKAIVCLINEGYDMGSTSIQEIEAIDTIPNSAPPALRLELARLEYARQQKLCKKRSPERNQLPLGPLSKLTIARNLILEKAIEMQRMTIALDEDDVSLKTKAGSNKRKNESDIEHKIVKSAKTVENVRSISTLRAEEDAVVEEDEAEAVAYNEESNDDDENHRVTRRSSNIKNASNIVEQDDYGEFEKIEFAEVNRSRNNKRAKRKDAHNSIKYPVIPQGSLVMVSSGALSGIQGYSTGYTTSGDSVRLDYVDMSGITRRTAVLRKNVSIVGPNLSGLSSNDISKNPAKSTFCICGKPQTGIYVKCQDGLGGCNGWVHPKCCEDLEKLSFEELQSIDSKGYDCLACRKLRESLKSSSSASQPLRSQPPLAREILDPTDNEETDAISRTLMDKSEYDGLESFINPEAMIAKQSSSEPSSITDYSLLRSSVPLEYSVVNVGNNSGKYDQSDSIVDKPIASKVAHFAGNRIIDVEVTLPVSEIDEKINKWISDIAYNLPGLVGEPIKRPVSISTVKSLWDRMFALNISSSNRAYACNLSLRLTAFVKCIERLDQTVQDDLEKVRAVLELQEGKMEDEILKRNVMEKKLGQLLNVTYDSHTKIGIRCPSLQIILRVLAWCNTVYTKLSQSALRKEDRHDVISQSDEFLQSAKRMPVVETFKTVWKSRVNVSKDGVALSEQTDLTAKDYSSNHCRKYDEDYQVTSYLKMFQSLSPDHPNSAPHVLTSSEQNSERSDDNESIIIERDFVDIVANETKQANEKKIPTVITIDDDSSSESHLPVKTVSKQSQNSELPSQCSVSGMPLIHATPTDHSTRQAEIPTAIPVASTVGRSVAAFNSIDSTYGNFMSLDGGGLGFHDGVRDSTGSGKTPNLGSGLSYGLSNPNSYLSTKQFPYQQQIQFQHDRMRELQQLQLQQQQQQQLFQLQQMQRQQASSQAYISKLRGSQIPLGGVNQSNAYANQSLYGATLPLSMSQSLGYGSPTLPLAYLNQFNGLSFGGLTGGLGGVSLNGLSAGLGGNNYLMSMMNAAATNRSSYPTNSYINNALVANEQHRLQQARLQQQQALVNQLQQRPAGINQSALKQSGNVSAQSSKSSNVQLQPTASKSTMNMTNYGSNNDMFGGNFGTNSRISPFDIAKQPTSKDSEQASGSTDAKNSSS